MIQLPRGFSYTTFSWTGDTMTDGNKVRVGHDGMAVVAGGGRGGVACRARVHQGRLRSVWIMNFPLVQRGDLCMGVGRDAA